MSILMSLVPVILNVVIEAYSWRTAWIVAAVLVWVIVIPIAQWGLIDRPSDVGQYPDGVAPATDDATAVALAPSVTHEEAIRTSRFWIVAIASATVGLLSTALNFHQISMLGDAGLSATEAAAMFLPQVIGAAVAGVVFGYLADRLTGRILIPMVMHRRHPLRHHPRSRRRFIPYRDFDPSPPLVRCWPHRRHSGHRDTHHCRIDGARTGDVLPR